MTCVGRSRWGKLATGHMGSLCVILSSCMCVYSDAIERLGPGRPGCPGFECTPAPWWLCEFAPPSVSVLICEMGRSVESPGQAREGGVCGEGLASAERGYCPRDGPAWCAQGCLISSRLSHQGGRSGGGGFWGWATLGRRLALPEPPLPPLPPPCRQGKESGLGPLTSGPPPASQPRR